MAITPTPNPIFARRPEDAQREVNKRTTLRRISSRRVMKNALQSRNAVKEIATLPAMEETLHIIARGNFPLSLLDQGKIKRVAIVASVYFQRQDPDEYRQMHEGLCARGQRIAALRTHAKIITFALSDGTRYAVESSANLRSCHNIEQITITQSPALVDFHARWVDDAIATAAAEEKKGNHGR